MLISNFFNKTDLAIRNRPQCFAQQGGERTVGDVASSAGTVCITLTYHRRVRTIFKATISLLHKSKSTRAGLLSANVASHVSTARMTAHGERRFSASHKFRQT